MTNVILYNIVQKNEYHLQKLVDDFEGYSHDGTQGIIINEYSENFLKAMFWQKRMKKTIDLIRKKENLI